MAIDVGDTATASDLDVLWEPIKIGHLSIRNRVLMSAMGSRYGTPDGMFEERYAAFLGARSRGGAGMVITEAVAIHETGAVPGITHGWKPEWVDSLKLVADAVKPHGARLFVQLWHVGHQDTGIDDIDSPHALLGPSPVPSPVFGRVPRVMGHADIQMIVEHFALVAKHAQAGGADGVELSASHGYLLTQFLSPFTNQRTDEYGGSVENRCRLVLEIGHAIRAVVGDRLPLGVRLSFDEFIGERAITPEYTEAVLVVLHAAGLFDYFHVTGGNYHTTHQFVPPMSADVDGHFAENGERAKRAVGGEVPVCVTSAIRDVQRAAQIVGRGQADMVGMTRAQFADPDLVAKARSGRIREIRRCVGANQGCWARTGAKNMIACTVNPASGREGYWDIGTPAAVPKRVLIVGGGPAGMVTARVAASRGHTVALVDRAQQLGGSLRCASSLPDQGGWLRLIEDLRHGLAESGVEVRLSTEATAESILDEGADEIVLATGARFDRSGFSVLLPFRDKTPGLDLIRTLTIDEAIADPDSCGSSVVVFDDVGNHAPLGLARVLATAGASVEIVTPQLHVGSQTVFTNDFAWTYPAAVQCGVVMTPQSFIDRVDDDGVHIAGLFGGALRVVAATCVVLNMRRLANSELADRLIGDPNVHTIGDCVAPRLVDDAIYEAERLAGAL